MRILLFLTLFLFSGLSFSAINTSPPDQKEVKVNIALFIDDISNVNEENEIIEFELRLYLNWLDKRLAFPIKDNQSKQIYRGAAALERLKQIWVPPYTFPQSRDEIKIKEVELIIESNGNVTLLQRICGEIETKLDMRRFPFDKQKIDIHVAQLYLSENNVVFVDVTKHQGFSPYARLPEWDLLKFDSHVTNAGKIYTYSVYLKHNSKFYIYRVVIPLVVIIILSWSVFWLPEQRLINRMQFVLTTLLATLIFQWTILRDIPHVSYPTFFGEVLFFSFMTLALVIIILVIDLLIKKPLAERIIYHARWFVALFYLVGILGLVLYNFVWL